MQFIAYDNPNKATRKAYPYLLDIQSPLLSHLGTTVVIPLVPAAAIGQTITKLNPLVSLDGMAHAVMTQQISGYERKLLTKPRFDLREHRAEILAAIDFVLIGI